MPLRLTPFRAAAAATAAPLHIPGRATVVHHHHQYPSLSSSFHSTPSTRRDEDRENNNSKTHYEILNVPPGASPAEIKKSFYALSKAHHPDHNRHDPAAPRRFMRISEAYGVLSSAERRAKYDRDVLRLHERPAHGQHGHGQSSNHNHNHRSGGSYSSTGPAGGRPASGLSRRRGAFRGPPPSFFRNGGWGAYQAKRSQAHEEATGGVGGDGTTHSGDGGGGGGAGFGGFGGGMGPGQDPLGNGGDAAAGGGGGGGVGDIPHFDRAARAAHTRTQARVDELRRRRMSREYRFPSAGDWGESGSFFAILTVLGIAIGVPYFLTRDWAAAPPKKKDWDRTAKG